MQNTGKATKWYERNDGNEAMLVVDSRQAREQAGPHIVGSAESGLRKAVH